METATRGFGNTLQREERMTDNDNHWSYFADGRKRATLEFSLPYDSVRGAATIVYMTVGNVCHFLLESGDTVITE